MRPLTRDHLTLVVQKLKNLPPEGLAEVEDFINFVSSRVHSRALTALSMATSEPVLARIWDNAEDAAYDGS